MFNKINRNKTLNPSYIHYTFTEKTKPVVMSLKCVTRCDINPKTVNNKAQKIQVCEIKACLFN